MLSTALDGGRHSIDFCSGSAEAIKRVRESAVDVVITDPTTTIDEDLALVSELRDLRPSVRIIVLAPDASQTDVVDAIRANVFACFSSPFDYSEIASMAETAVAAVDWDAGIQVISGLPHWLTLRVSCHLVTADRLVRFMIELQSHVPADRDLLITAFREMLLNAMEHGAGFDPDKVIEVTAARTARAIVYHFRDPGTGFDAAALESVAAATSEPAVVLATAVRRAEMGLRPGGFGMLIVRNIVDELVYNERGNEVILVKHLC
jgi:anti-sigma regulatory factor (Ser/Thr protein kinase)